MKMASSCVMKQLREKHVSAEIFMCAWSPKMDLLAIVNAQGQVTLHRLSWQQVWVLNAPTENVKVTTLAWRMDSKVLAVGYTSGKVLLVNIEDSSTVHELDLKEEVTALSWNKFSDGSTDQDSKYEKKDPWLPYMYPLPPLNKTFGESGIPNQSDLWQEPRLLQDQTELNVLIIGTVSSVLHLYAFGLFHIATVNIADTNTSVKKILHVVPSANFSIFSLVLERDEGGGEKEIAHCTIETELLASRHRELHSLAQKYGQIYSIMTYIKHTLMLIEEAWESALIEMDAKLATYSTSVPEGGVSADFLELLVFGHSSAEFEIFLTNKLTEKGLKKLRHSVDLCYSTMQRLVVKHLEQVGVTLVFLLSQVEGMSKRRDQFSALGVHETEVEAAMGEAGSFLLKASEMLQAIEASMKDFHTFVRWVSSVHLRLLHDQVPPDLCRISQQEMGNLLSFLNESFEEVITNSDGERRTRFRLERAGQYLKNEELKTLPNTEATPFAKLLSSNPTLASHRLIFEHRKRTSLIQEHQSLTEALTKMGDQPAIAISASIVVGACIGVAKLDSNYHPAITQISVPLDGTIICVIVPSVRQPTLYVVELPSSLNCMKTAPFIFSKLDGHHSNSPQLSILDAHFYSSETLSILLQDPNEVRTPYFAQVAIRSLRTQLKSVPLENGCLVSEMNIPITDVSSLPDAMGLRRLETGPATSIAVSGPRKVAAVIGENRRRVRIYEMEVEEDDDEDDDDDTKNESLINASGVSDDLNDTL